MAGDKLETHIERWQIAQAGREYWTREARLDMRIAAGKTWTRKEMQIFRDQGREPPSYDLTGPMVGLVCGIEAQSRSDITYLPRRPQDQDGTEAATKIGFLVRDENGTDRQLSRQFEWSAKVGVGYMEVAANPSPFSCGILERCLNPFDIYPDPASKEPDQTDALDIFRSIVTYPTALALRFPKFAKEIMAAMGTDGSYSDLNHSSDFTDSYGDYPGVNNWNDFQLNDYYGQPGDNKPKQIRAVERWYKTEAWQQFVRTRDGRVFEPTESNARNLAQMLTATDAAGNRYAKTIRAVVPKIRVAIFLPEIPDLMLGDDESPYSHRRFPFIPMWAYHDEQGIPAGIVRRVRTPQRDLNARMAHLLKNALNSQTHYEAGAFVDADAALDAMALPNGAIEYNPGMLERVRRETSLEASPVETQLLHFDQQMIQDYSGASAEQLGAQTNATSNVALQNKEHQGQTRLYTLFDNRNWTMEQIGRIRLSLIKDTFTDEQIVRTTDSDKGVAWLTVNKTNEATGDVENDLTQMEADCKVSEVDQKATENMAQFEALTNIATQLPEAAKMILLPKLIKLANVPDADDLCDELKKLQQQGPPPPPPPNVSITMPMDKAPPWAFTAALQEYAHLQPPPGTDPNQPTMPAGVQDQAAEAERQKQAAQLSAQEHAQKLQLNEQAHQHRLIETAHKAGHGSAQSLQDAHEAAALAQQQAAHNAGATQQQAINQAGLSRLQAVHGALASHQDHGEALQQQQQAQQAAAQIAAQRPQQGAGQ